MRNELESALKDIREAKDDQVAKWGYDGHDFPEWLVILSEEYGEFAHEIIQFRNLVSMLPNEVGSAKNIVVRDQLLKMRYEAAQVGAVAWSILEQIHVLESLLSHESLEDAGGDTPQKMHAALALLGIRGW
jgi:hypothetical protein